MNSTALQYILVNIALGAGLISFFFLEVGRHRSRRKRTFCVCFCFVGFALMFAIFVVASFVPGNPGLSMVSVIIVVLSVLAAVLQFGFGSDPFSTGPLPDLIPSLDEQESVQESVQAYIQGDLWLSELVARLGRSLAEEEAATLLASLSPDIGQQLRKYLEECPQTKEDWSRNWGYKIGVWSRRLHRRELGFSRQEVNAEEAQAVRSLCRGVEVLRDGISPFPPGTKVLDSSLLGWNDGTIMKLAQAIRDKQGFEQLPILADALEDAGCADEQILEHLRGPGPHHRSCWCLALILEQAVVSSFQDPNEAVS